MTPNPATLLASLGAAVLLRQSRASFVPLWAVPSWCASLGPDAFRVDVPCAIAEVLPFFDLFLPDAEAIWSANQDGRLDSEGFTQMLPDGKELHLFATAFRIAEVPLLIVFQNEAAFEQELLLLQRGRELRAAHDALSQEVERRDVLTHCVIHDLRNPLTAIVGALGVLQRSALHEADAELVTVATLAAQQQASLIADILTTFSDRGALGSEELTWTDLAGTVRQVASMLEPTARARGVGIEVRQPAPGVVDVCAEPLRLFRVIGNLLENALRYSGPETSICISVEEDPEGALVRVDDEGPGVPPAFVPLLFKKFARLSGASGTGLGLYFCRITVEGWGGSIGYEPRDERGSRFWFRLPTSCRTPTRCRPR